MKTKRMLWIGLGALALGAAAWSWGPWRRPPASFCGEHGVPEAECIVCHPELAGGSSVSAQPGLCATEKIRIAFAAPEVAQAVGVATEELKPRRMAETVRANGRVVFDATRTAKVSSRIPGVLREVLKDLGQDVAAGEVLFVVDSLELGEAEAELLQAEAEADLALKNVQRERALSERAATSQKELLAAEAEHQSAQARAARASDRLRNLGLTEEAIAHLRKDRRISSRLAVTAPVTGTVVERVGAVGDMVDPSRPILTVTDLTKVWVILDLFERDLDKIALGQKATFLADAYPEHPFTGLVSWISSSMDPESRTLTVRVEVEDAQRRLKAHCFGKGEIEVREEPQALLVPKEAVQWEGCHHVVFVPLQEGTYQTRKIKLGWAGDTFYEVMAGLLPGERVVTTGSFLMKTEILKGAIGAG